MLMINEGFRIGGPNGAEAKVVRNKPSQIRERQLDVRASDRH